MNHLNRTNRTNQPSLSGGPNSAKQDDLSSPPTLFAAGDLTGAEISPGPVVSPLQVFVTGGVVSSLGKGITAASLGRLLTARGLRVVMQKLDPYLNVDPGTMNPLEHGEVYVTNDGAEVDLDLGHYERFVGGELTGASSVTAGSVYQAVLARERRGGYLGRTVQVIPHITNEICARVLALHQTNVDVVITEIGGTVGDIESLPFLEAARQLRSMLESVVFIHVTLVPVLTNGEQKSKPTQHSVMELRSRGITPDILVARCSEPLGAGVRAKMAELCGVQPDDVIEALDARILYEVPLSMAAQGLDTRVLTRGGRSTWLTLAPDLTGWEAMVARVSAPMHYLRVGVVGKYAGPDAYLSVMEALGHAGSVDSVSVTVELVDAESLAGAVPNGSEGSDAPGGHGGPDLDLILGSYDALVVPGGFGERGFEGKIAALCWARTHSVPTLGICLGLQAMVVETARSLCHLPDAHSSELDPDTVNPVVDLLADQRGVVELGGTMRLGAWPAELAPGSRVAEAYGELLVSERHRHRYEVNPAYRGVLGAAGLIVSGTSPDGRLVEYVERTDHPYYLACQAHPEFLSRPESGHPLFLGLLRAARARQVE